MIWITVLFILLLTVTWLKNFLSDTRDTVSEVLGDVVLASRMQMSALSVEDMRHRNIYPFFCYQEYKMVWVEEPSDEEHCPWCSQRLIPCS